jgi:hypothetical protein
MRWSQPDSETQLGSETPADELFSALGRVTFPCARRRQRMPLTAARRHKENGPTLRLGAWLAPQPGWGSRAQQLRLTCYQRLRGLGTRLQY